LSTIVIAGCVLLLAGAIAALAVTWDPCSVISGVVILPLPVTLGIQQFRGTFRCNSKAALISSMLLFVVGGFALLAFAVTLGDMILKGVRIPWLGVLLPMLVTGIVGGVAAWMNLKWSRRLRRSAETTTTSPDLARLSMRELSAAVAAIACVTGLSTYFVRSTPPRCAENVALDKAPFGMPAGATEISYCQGFRGIIAYEFTIDEKSFAAWVASGIGSLESDAANVSLQSIARPYTIERFYGLSADLSGPHSITITDGLFYDWSKEDRGVHAAFDRATSRAYYFAHFH
jgi:hypothetical protein